MERFLVVGKQINNRTTTEQQKQWLDGRCVTCERLDAGALKEAGRAVVIVELLVGQFKARVDAAVLLRDLNIIEVRGGRHG